MKTTYFVGTVRQPSRTLPASVQQPQAATLPAAVIPQQQPAPQPINPFPSRGGAVQPAASPLPNPFLANQECHL